MAGVLGAFLTSIYTFRLIFVVFHGEEKIHAHPGHGVSYALPLVVLLILSTLVGAFIHQPLAGVLPANPGAGTGTEKEHLALLSGVVALAGVAVAAWLYLGERKLVKAVAASAPGRFLTALWLNAFGFDLLYDLLFVKPYLAIVNFNRRDGFDAVVGFIPRLMKLGHDMLSVTENGRLRWYAATVAGGVVLLLATLALV
jgi:NADH-quinone oxidoreductase subunit L